VSSSADPMPGAARRRPRWRDLCADERGISAIEIALVIGMLMLIIFATIDFGRALAAKNEMSHALGRAARVVNLNPATTEEEVEALLEEYLQDYDTADLEVEISEVSGTSYMQISVSFPFHTALAFRSDSEILLSVSTLAPMVSPTL
jgi:Flp pilus assembly protein TadG